MLPVPQQSGEASSKNPSVLIGQLKKFRKLVQCGHLYLEKQAFDVLNDAGCQRVAARERTSQGLVINEQGRFAALESSDKSPTISENERYLREEHQKSQNRIASAIAEFCTTNTKEYDPRQQTLDDFRHRGIVGLVRLERKNLEERITHTEALTELQIKARVAQTNNRLRKQRIDQGERELGKEVRHRLTMQRLENETHRINTETKICDVLLDAGEDLPLYGGVHSNFVG